MSKQGQRARPIDPKAVAWIPADDLMLDHENPRLTGQEFRPEDQEDILAALWREREVSELVDSIAATGYWAQEVLYAARENGHLVVLEGNRRLAAVKLLHSRALCEKIGARWAAEKQVPAALAKTYEKLPVIVCNRVDLWMYMGFRHVNGPQEWDSIAKAEYIADVHEKYDISLERIAATIGDRNATVYRLYRGLAILRQAEREGLYDKANAWNPKNFPYSHLWTALGYANVQRYLGIYRAKKEAPLRVPKDKYKHLAELCVWLFGDREREIPPHVRSQNPNLRQLIEVLGGEDGVAALRAGQPLTVALRITQGDENLLREELINAETALRAAIGYVPTGYSKKEKDLRLRALTVRKLAVSITQSMALPDDEED